ncbi:aldehyde dehydrogenase family protein [Pseudomonas hefeiensis]|uniref:Aldehyde dehydrogenase family protein n=1 Tax=Pseudomonas hefeiensis TaxID=2738125 RepID=A0ABY9GH04_9PSED|nr:MULTISPECIES: aldehyde dehydrogenase family protein [unclassified Pseudomonas]WLH14822.1 aldehyde dehydrogenase family protein [Pseudomonas sp. FP205]WLH97874.1 aldehyde dehydrogenase family protein [Pseudomonas sp. FP53]WLI42148.1 aldehyde dehydrogenase family protein [Pseudomonas sp. FP821]
MKSLKFALSINGRMVSAMETATAINPATEEPICQFPLASREQLEEAVQAASDAFSAWSSTPITERQRLVGALGNLIEENQEAFIELLITEQGKGRAGAEWEIGGSIHWCREIAKQSLKDEVVLRDGDEAIVTRYTPIGVIGAITPWNFPLLLAIWKIAPALLAGNTMVLKPSPFTPLCTLWFGELANRVLPAGVLNVLSGGNELGQWMTEHPGIGKISFTGSTATGKRVMQSASVNLKRLTLELGGNDPAIVLPDVDAKAIAKDLFWACFSNSAQFCVAGKRLYIHEEVYDDVARELVAYARTVKMGNGMEPGVELGPLQNKMQFEKVKELLQDCKDNQQRFLLGGELTKEKGYFIPVTIVDNPPEDARCVVEEAFGPVLPLLKYSSIDEVIGRANQTEYGLAASVWSNNLEAAQLVARKIEAGTVWINHAHQFSPRIAFGGHKNSGMGIENSLHGLAEYTNMQTVLQKAPVTGRG